jgi:DNA-binding transcriptional regulator YiaG
MDRRDELEEYRVALSAANKLDEAQFHLLVQYGVRLLELSDADLAHDLDMSLASLARWRAGRNAPRPAMRTFVYEKLARRTSTLLDQDI